MKMKLLLGILLVISTSLNAQEEPFITGKFDSDARFSSNPIVHNNTIYCGNDHNVFFTLDAITLKKQWSLKTTSKNLLGYSL